MQLTIETAGLAMTERLMTYRRQFLVGSASLALWAPAVFPGGASAANAQNKLTFEELYSERGVLGNKISQKVLTLSGKPIVMRGYMAPPLKPEADFFVLTREPVAICPFCSSDADWPDDIVVVYLQRAQSFVQQGRPIEVTGTLEVGSKTDSVTGFVSLLRITGASYAPL